MKAAVWQFVLAIVIVLQSFSAIESQELSSAFDSQHFQSEHQHQITQATQSTDSHGHEVDEHGHPVSDCHHCGHCSGSHTLWSLVKYKLTLENDLNEQGYAYLNQHPKLMASSHYRPPIRS